MSSSFAPPGRKNSALVISFFFVATGVGAGVTGRGVGLRGVGAGLGGGSRTSVNGVGLGSALTLISAASSSCLPHWLSILSILRVWVDEKYGLALEKMSSSDIRENSSWVVLDSGKPVSAFSDIPACLV